LRRGASELERVSVACRWIPSTASTSSAPSVRHHEERYYVHASPEISDEEFDRLLHELERLESENPDLGHSGFTDPACRREAADGFPTVEHIAPMLSLDKRVQRRGAARLRRAGPQGRGGSATPPCPTSPELKIDGLSIALTYEDGRLVRGATRGDGVRGRT
jgi:DNA ligase (NAD+)